MLGLTCVRVGYGEIARLHQTKLQSLGVRLSGIYDSSLLRRQEARRDGRRVLSGLDELKRSAFDFWDVCVSTAGHFRVIQEILRLDPAANILVEKPVCAPEDIERMRSLSRSFPCRISVNETYYSSRVLQLVKHTVEQLRITPKRISVEMSKDRRDDIRQGRFVDEELGILGYEGSHMLAALQQLGDEFLPEEVDSVVWSGMTLEQDGKTRLLPRQGSVDIRYRACHGVEVQMFSSMTGDVRRPVLCFRPGRGRRYRVLDVEGVDPSGDRVQVIGLFEPIQTLERGQGVMLVYKNSRLAQSVVPVEDDHMQSHLSRVCRYFQGRDDNPCSVEQGLAIVQWLQSFASTQEAGRSSERRIAA
jgi:predicted dehydrogenase